ncbi:MAG: putative Ig domain-containing protein [Steroidobacteraceae bacterium]
MNSFHQAAGRWALALFSLVVLLVPDAHAAYRYTNRPPTISGTPATEVVLGQPYSFAPNATDPEGRTLVFSIFGLPQWARFDRYTGQLSGTPGAANVGTTGRIVIAVSDKRTMVYLPEFRITVRSDATGTPNTAPTITGAASGTATVGVAYAFQPTASDAEGNALTFGIANQPAWATFSNSTGRLSGTPTTAEAFSAITISASDGTATTSLAPFAIVVSAPTQPNVAPIISGTPSTTVGAGVAYSFQPTASDANGNALGFSIANKPAWASFSTTTGRLSGTPSGAAVHSGIVISVSDGIATTSLPAFAITVTAAANRAPVIAGTPATSINVGGTYSFTPAASDADGNPLTFSIANKPIWATFNAATGQLSGAPAAGNVATFSGISITVSDGLAIATLAPFAISVAQISVGSASLTWVAPTQNTDGTALTNLSGYRVYYGTSATTMTQTVTIANASISTYVVDNLSPATWYFAVKAIANGQESALSKTALKVVQ